MRPFTLHGQKTGTIGTMAANPGMIFCRGAGENHDAVSMPCAVLGVIGTIGTMISTYARARGRGVMAALCALGLEKGNHFLTRSLKTSSLSSLSSLKGLFLLKDQRLGFSPLGQNILPEMRSILPILPEFGSGFQGVVGCVAVATKYSERGAE